MCRSDDALYRLTVLPGVLKADQCSHDEKYVNWNEAAIRELLTFTNHGTHFLCIFRNGCVKEAIEKEL